MMGAKLFSEYPGIKMMESSWMRGGIALPPFVIIVQRHAPTWLKQHEYGHYLQYREVGFFKFYWKFGLPSLFNMLENELEMRLFKRLVHSVPHDHHYAETDANRRVLDFFSADEGLKREMFNIQPCYPSYGRLKRIGKYIAALF